MSTTRRTTGIVWDVGHQAYPHKVLTGRRERLHTIKQNGGLAPFPTPRRERVRHLRRRALEHLDQRGLGMAVAAAQLQGENRRAVAVIGDGAMTAGMAFEALNHAGSLPTDLLVVLNDNDMSISENVGALSNYFARALSGRMYAHLREGGKKMLRADADGARAGAALRGAPEGHGAARARCSRRWASTTSGPSTGTT